MMVLPPEVCTHIVRHATPLDLLTLSRASKALQRAAESKIYEHIVLRDVTTAYQVCQALVAHDGCRGPYVRRFWFYQEGRRGGMRNIIIPHRFWQGVQAALTTMINLDYLYIVDPTIRNSWILDSPEITFQLREANLTLTWNAHMVRFLEKQNRLRTLYVEDSIEDGPLRGVASNKLQALEQFNGPLLVLLELLASPLTHVQILLDEVAAPILCNAITDLGKIKRDLRSLSVLFIPEDMLLETLQLVSTSIFAPGLRYLGTLTYPIHDRHDIYRCLVPLRALQTIDLDVTAWVPQPMDVYQRMLAIELRTFCPSLQCVGFWIGQHHIVWICHDEEWMNGQLTGRSPLHENIWRHA